MSTFTICNDAGEPEYTFSCPDEFDDLQEAPSGKHLFHGELGPRDMVDMATGDALRDVWPAKPAPPTPVPEPDYVRARRLAYPPLEQQMEWIWQGMDQGLLPKIEPFYSQILAVKVMFPKTADPLDVGASVAL